MPPCMVSELFLLIKYYVKIIALEQSTNLSYINVLHLAFVLYIYLQCITLM
jgi:hypothetical protein